MSNSGAYESTHLMLFEKKKHLEQTKWEINNIHKTPPNVVNFSLHKIYSCNKSYCNNANIFFHIYGKCLHFAVESVALHVLLHVFPLINIFRSCAREWAVEKKKGLSDLGISKLGICDGNEQDV